MGDDPTRPPEPGPDEPPDLDEPAAAGPDGGDPDGTGPVVRRDAARAASDAARRRKLALIAAAVVAALAVIGGVVFAVTRDEERTAATSTTTTSTSSSTTTTEAPVTGPIAPLTGLLVDDRDGAAVARLQRPALVGKIDNAPEAMPQIGLDRADVVIELKVEGISRYMAVVHSQDVSELGPIRSARTSDPDLLAMFVRPLVAWSGGNPTVTRVMDRTPWIQSLNPDQAPGAYSRTSSKRAPHNLVVDVPALYALAEQPPALPVPLFLYLAPGADPGGVPVPGFDLSVGASPSSWVWAADTGTWRRWANGVPQTVEGGGQLTASNVVVLATPYGTSAADRISPEAQTLGSGTAWVFTQGRMVEGRWDRAQPAQPWQLTRPDGSPIQLTPGVTWVELPSPDSGPRLLDQARADQLLAG